MEEEKTITLSKDLFQGLLVKKKERRVKRIKLEKVKEARKRQRDIREKRRRDEIIGDYQMQLGSKQNNKTLNTTPDTQMSKLDK